MYSILQKLSISNENWEREKIFENDKDRETFLEILGSVVKRYNSLCHAYCLMNNHYHLLGRHSFVQKMKEIPRIERFTIRPRFSEIFSQIRNEIEQNSQFKT